MDIKDTSDGVQAFTGIVSAVRSGEFSTVLVDEPEAFLHPPLARKLGRSLAILTSEQGGSLLAATHSADFLMGCVQESTAVRVIRLEHSAGKSSARMIDDEALRTLLRRPLMRSANVVSGLFHDGVIVCESDNDRAFYNEIYHRLLQQDATLPSILFVNAQNKQTIKDIIGPLRQFGVPAAAVPDLDVVKDGGKTWSDWLQAANVPESMRVSLGQQRSAIKTIFETSIAETTAGIDKLKGQDAVSCRSFLSTLNSYGLFPVPCGEVENWLKDLNVGGKKATWTLAMLERLGEDPATSTYVRPASGDVWAFLHQIISWVRDTTRRGLPSN